MPRCPTRSTRTARLRGLGPVPRSMSKRCSRRSATRYAARAPIPEAGGDPADRRAARDEAERLWPVSADRSLRLRPGVRGGVGTPVKAVLRKLMRWYVEPLAYDQRSFNAAALRLIDDLQEQVDGLAGRGGGASRREALATDADRRVQAPGAVRAGRGRDLHATRSSTSCARAATRRRSSPSRSSGIRAPACSRRPSSGGCST